MTLTLSHVSNRVHVKAVQLILSCALLVDITLVMSIGLLVDFILHNLIRFYELPGNREEKVVQMLQTMGSSIMMGAITTFLGTLPLAFSSSAIFTTVFVSFIAIVTLGASHGLILLPVVLSLWGPEDDITDPKRGAN